MAFRLKPFDYEPEYCDDGTIRKAPERRKRIDEGKDETYLRFVRSLPCVITGVTDGIEAHHLTVGRERMAKREDDSLALPLNTFMHNNGNDALHHIGERNFWNRWGVNPFHLCQELFDYYTHKGADYRVAANLIKQHRDMGSARVALGAMVFY